MVMIQVDVINHIARDDNPRYGLCGQYAPGLVDLTDYQPRVIHATVNIRDNADCVECVEHP